MKYLLAFLAVLFLAFPVFAQTARDNLKADPTVAATNMTDAELDALINAIKERDALIKADQARRDATKRMEEMLEADAQLKTDLMNE